jgi:hypothetical protein
MLVSHFLAHLTINSNPSVDLHVLHSSFDVFIISFRLPTTHFANVSGPAFSSFFVICLLTIGPMFGSSVGMWAAMA